MDKAWWEDLGNILDTLWHILRNSDDSLEWKLKEHYEALKEIYLDVGNENHYFTTDEEN